MLRYADCGVCLQRSPTDTPPPPPPASMCLYLISKKTKNINSCWQITVFAVNSKLIIVQGDIKLTISIYLFISLMGKLIVNSPYHINTYEDEK